MGVIAVAFFFGQRGCSWLPENRVKTVISENRIIIGDSIQAILDCLSEDSQPIYDILNYNGDVDFSKSDTKSDQKTYWFDGADGFTAEFKINEEDRYSELVSINQTGKNCETRLLNDKKHTLILPKKILNQIIESHKFVLYDTVKYQIECYEIPEDSLYRIHLKSTGYSSPSEEKLVNKIFNVTTEFEGNQYIITYEIGENRTRIQNVAGETPCEN